jgi:hypothetical protein
MPMISPYLTTHEAAEYYRFLDKQGRPSVTLVQMWLLKHPLVVVKKRGRALLILKESFDAELDRCSAQAGYLRPALTRVK